MNINIEQMPFGAAILKGPSLNIEAANRAFYSLFSTSPKIGLSISSISELNFLPDLFDEYSVGEYIRRTITLKNETSVEVHLNKAGEEVTAFFYELPSKKGTENKKVEETLQRMKEEREQFINISTELKTKCDIIEILRKREKENMMHLKDVMNNISEGLIVLDSSGKYSFSNKSIYSVLDLDPYSLNNYPNIFSNYEIVDIKDENIREKGLEIFDCKQRIRNLIILLRHSETGEKKYIEFNNNPIKNENNEFLYSIVTLKDVTAIRLHEILVQEQAAFIKEVVDTMDVPVAVVTYPQLELTLLNERLASIIREALPEYKQESIGKAPDVKQILNSLKLNQLSRILQECGSLGVERSYSPYELTSGEKKRYYKINFKPLKGRQKRTNLILLSAIDITEEICRNLELEKLTKLKDEFFTVISHELRTPLTVIYSSLQLAYNVYGNEITPNIHKNLLRIEQNCSRLLKLINNILDISKAEAGFLSLNNMSFDIIEASKYIVDSINTYAKVKEINLSFRSSSSSLIVNMDKDKYEKILLNLLSNAMKFTPKGKAITVTVKELKRQILLSVKDEGIGIPKDKISSIFDRFAQVNSSLSRQAEGTGLGLSLVKKFIDIMGGTIEVKSTEDKGTEFIIRFNKNFVKEKSENFSFIDVNVREKINIEFSDVN